MILWKLNDLGVDSVGGQQHRGLWWTVDLLLKDLLLHLRSKKMQPFNPQTNRTFSLLLVVEATLV